MKKIIFLIFLIIFIFFTSCNKNIRVKTNSNYIIPLYTKVFNVEDMIDWESILPYGEIQDINNIKTIKFFKTKNIDISEYIDSNIALNSNKVKIHIPEIPIIKKDDPINFEIPISDEATLSLNDIEIIGFKAVITGEAPDGIIDESNKFTLCASYTLKDNTEDSTSINIILNSKNINTDATNFFEEALKYKDVYLTIKSTDLYISPDILNDYDFYLNIDLTIPLNFKYKNNSDLIIYTLKNEKDILNRENNNIDSLNISNIKLFFDYDNSSGFVPGIKILGYNDNNILLEKSYYFKEGDAEKVLDFDADNINSIINNKPFFVDVLLLIPSQSIQAFKTNGIFSFKSWIEIENNINLNYNSGE